MSYSDPTPLDRHHTLDPFVCRSEEQTRWLKKFARQSASSDLTKVYVVTESSRPEAVVAYYAWCMANLSLTAIPEGMTKGAGRYPQPVVLLARLGVDTDHEGQGLGYGMLQDVLQRTAVMSAGIGCRGLLIHAESNAARDYYLHLIPEFAASPTDPLHLILRIKDIRRSLGL
ncbi:MAG: N-acetyltransferase [Sporichthyaceae bacterium]